MNYSISSLFRKTLLSLVTTILLILLCYFWADLTFAFWIDHENFKRFPIFNYATHFVDLIMIWSALYYFYFAWSFSKQRDPREKSWPGLIIANSVSISIFIKDALKAPFGRYWPSTWTNNNPSLIHDHAYGFHWFHQGVIYQSFPSGHTTVALAFLTALWLTYSNRYFRCLGLLVALSIIIGLLANNYHFLGDCVAGAWVGATTAYYIVVASRTFSYSSTRAKSQ